MEFNEKLQELRKSRGLTQDELAEKLYVSRTAISKWESGKGYPSIDSLKAISQFFSVSLDTLLSSNEAIQLAEESEKKVERRFCDLVFGLLDICMALLLFLPLFASRKDGAVESVSLTDLAQVQAYTKALILAVVIGSAIFGIATLAMQGVNHKIWIRAKMLVSLMFSIVSVLVLILCLHPYAAAFAFVLLVVKALMLIKKK